MTAKEILNNLAASAAQNPGDGVAATRYAKELQKQGHAARAAAEYRRALSLDETLVEAWQGIGCLELDSGAVGAAIPSFRRALDLDPSRIHSHFNLGKAYFALGEIDGALGHFKILADSSNPEVRRTALRAIACIVPCSPLSDNSAVLQARRAWAQMEAQSEIPAGPVEAQLSPGREKLRLGYCSDFFHSQNWMKPVWGVINHHDRSRFEIHLLSGGKLPGPDTGYDGNQHDKVHDVRGLSNDDLAALTTSLNIDVLVDLNGYSSQSRLGFLMRRPAPVVVGWFNVYATTGIDAFDYIIGDAVVIPPEEEQFYCERILRVPGSYLAFSVLYPVPDISPPPSAAAGQITFGSMCSQYKITEQVIAAWAAILRRVPSARIYLKNAALADATNRRALLERFSCWEIGPERLLLDGQARHFEFLKAYERVDIALDTFPYNGGTTTMEALWQGVPVLSFNGDRWASRQSCSLLRAAGLDDWCMPDRDAYIDRAISLACSPDTPAALASMRSGMRERLRTSAVCGSAGLCRALETIYLDVSQRRRS